MELLQAHGGYRGLASFRIARLVYDVTVSFCERFIEAKSRTHDQMVQAARSGVQNIAEGSQASVTSRKTEIKLTGVARASLEELRLDYEDFLRQHGSPPWPPDHPSLRRFKERRCATLEDVQRWEQDEPEAAGSILAANAALSLLNLACFLLDRQLRSQADAFEKEGGFTERMYKVRKEARKN